MKQPSCFKRYKILITAVISVILTTIIVATIMGVIMSRSSGETDGIDNMLGDTKSESYQTTAIPNEMKGDYTITHTTTEATLSASLVIIGGYTTNRTSFDGNNVQIYTVNGGHVSWKREGSPAPYSWFDGGTAATGGNIYIVGGIAYYYTDSGSVWKVSSAAKYNIRDDSWELLPDKRKKAFYEPAVYVMENQLYAADAGTSGGTPEKLNLSDVDSGWTMEHATIPHDVAFTQAVVIENTAYICALSPDRKTVISWKYGESEWIPVANMNIARYRFHGTVTDGISNIWVIAGCDPDDCWPDGFIEQYSVATNTWTKLKHVPNIPRDLYNVQVCGFWQGHIYVIFQENNLLLLPSFYVYNTETGEWQQDSTEFTLPVYQSMSAIVP